MRKFIFLLLFPFVVFSQTLFSPTSQEVPIGVNGIGVSGRKNHGSTGQDYSFGNNVFLKTINNSTVNEYVN